MVCQDPLVERVCELYEKISSLESLKPSKHVDSLFTQLVLTCIPPNPIDVTKLCHRVQEIRSKLILLCGEAEGHLESHYSAILGSYDNPLDHLYLFPYFTNYLKLADLEFTILTQFSSAELTRVAFVGSGPLPLTSIVLAKNHMPAALFDNYDIDPSANSKARKLVSPDPNLSQRMFFHDTDIMDVTTKLKDYQAIFLAALVGMDREEKLKVIDHLGKHMENGAILMLRSAHGARGFLYPVVDPIELGGFEVLSVFHPTDEVINSVIIARKLSVRDHLRLQQGIGSPPPLIMMPSKCCTDDMHQNFNLLNHGDVVEKLAIEEQSS
ncbi:hypothetical protein MLD38_017803 [Melastoma candidum]|uniref:Uncharacterized protein n=1 Tax=Melastoma candidum TaxID=119954 RepID=A0ACB9QRA3_9MYRT|nr:hypothetical protein MLD38_017803 [Melastoma candidum]